MESRTLSILGLAAFLSVTACETTDNAPTNITDITVNRSSVTFIIGDQMKLEATTLPENASDRSVSWESSAPDIVSVGNDGTITALKEGRAEIYAVNGTIFGSCSVLVNAEPNVGDHYYSDGTYSTTLNTGKECIGVIYHVGHHPNDTSDYSETGIGMEKCHGYVVAIEDADGQCTWGSEEVSLDLFYRDTDGEPADNFTNNSGELEWSGFRYTMEIQEKALQTGEFTEERLKGYAATYYAVNYHLSAPEHSSGWFLPASSQLYEIYKSNDILNGLVNAGLTGDNWYWSSSEYYKIPDQVALFFNGQNKKIEGRSKSSGLFIRPVIAF